MIISDRVIVSNVLGTSRRLVVLSVLTSSVAYAFNHYLIQPAGLQLPSSIPAILGTALAFFIGFNNNQAYARWWEARKIWGGLVNDSRSWARQVIFLIHPSKAREKDGIEVTKRKMVFRHIAFVYALKEKLRGFQPKEYQKYVAQDEVEHIETISNKHNALLDIQEKELSVLYEAGAMDGFQFKALNELLVRFCDGMGRSERIKGTVFPKFYHRYAYIFI